MSASLSFSKGLLIVGSSVLLNLTEFTYSHKLYPFHNNNNDNNPDWRQLNTFDNDDHSIGDFESIAVIGVNNICNGGRITMITPNSNKK